MISKIPYTNIGGRYRPYLEVFFHNVIIDKPSSNTFAMVDSGADHTIIPYSIGVSMGLKEPTQEEVLSSVNGVGGGSLSYIQRTCHLYVVDRKRGQINGFDETVWWIYPDANMEDEFQKLKAEYLNAKDLQSQCIQDTALHNHFAQQMNDTMVKINAISEKLETHTLIGRPFFDNFEFLQFVHKDREKENTCFFNYKIIPSKIINTINIVQPAQVQRAQRSITNKESESKVVSDAKSKKL